MNIHFVFVILFLAFGCSTHANRQLKPQDLIISELKMPPEIISSKQAQEDIQFLIYALTKGYGGRNYTPSSSMHSAVQKIQAIVSVKNNEDFKNQIDEALLIIPDHHLKAKLRGKTSEARASLRKDGKVGKNAISDPEKTWEVRLDNIKKKKALYISITSFPSHKDDKWTGFLSEVKKALSQKSDLAIIDFRGNGGGDDTMGWKLAELLYGRNFDSPLTKQFTSQTPETFIIFSNYLRMLKMIRERDLEPVPSYFEESISETMQKYQEALDGKLPPESVRIETSKYAGQAIKGFKKPIFVLMDGECASSCESSIDFLEKHTFVKKVGENTAGHIHFANIGFVILPHSRIEVQIPTHYNEYFDGRFLERVGIKPDIAVPTGIDAYEYVKKVFAK